MTSKPTSVKPNNPFTFSLETPSLSSGTLDKYLKSVLGEDSTNTIPDLLKPGPSSDNLRKTDDIASEERHPGPVTTLPIIPPQIHVPLPTSNISHSSTVGQDLALPVGEISHIGQQLTTTNDNNELIPVPRGQNYIDITEYLNMPQADAAKKLGIPPSTLSKRWKEAVRKRKWPYRMICKIDKEIMTLLHNVPQGPNAPPLPEEIETALGISLRKRQEELRPVVIRI